MNRDYIDFQDRSTPLAYLLTIRTYGTWLHGDKRGSMDRREYNVYGGPRIEPSDLKIKRDINLMKSPPYLMNASARNCVKDAVIEVCRFRNCVLHSINVRTNHAHTVVSAFNKPEIIMNSFKSYATRRLRSEGLVGVNSKLWARHGSTRYLWTKDHIELAVEYVERGQGDDLPTFD